MPIEIRELVVTIDVDAGAGASGGQGPVSANAELIRECVEKVLEILEKQKER